MSTAAPPDPARVDEVRAHDGKHPISPLAGPYGHPFHPILVTVPIGAWVCSFAFDIASHLQGDTSKDEQVFTRGAYWLIALGIAGALVAAAFGLLDLLGIRRNTPAFRTGLIHMALNLTTTALFAIGFAWRYSVREEQQAVQVGQIVLSGAALALLGISGYLGGKLAYRYGVRVVDEGTQAEGFTEVDAAKP